MDINIGAFVIKGIPDDELFERWLEWKRALNHVLVTRGITKKKKKFSALMAFGGQDLQKLYYSIDKNADVDPPEFKDAILKLDEHFKPKHHAVFTRRKFWDIKREIDESIDDLIARVRSKAEICSFGSTEVESRQVAMGDKLISLMPQEVKEKLLQKDMPFDEMVKLIKAHESAKFQARELTTPKYVNNNFSNVNYVRKQETQPRSKECYRCGSKYHLSFSENCPAVNAICDSCKKKGHFARMCNLNKNGKRPRSQIQSGQEPLLKKRRMNVFNINNHDEKDQIKEEVTVCNVNLTGIHVVCSIGNIAVRLLVDSGTSKNIVDENTWKLMLANGFKPKEQFYDHTVKFFGYGNGSLTQISAFVDEISSVNNGKRISIVDKFYVIGNGSQPLLSKGNLFYDF